MDDFQPRSWTSRNASVLLTGDAAARLDTDTGSAAVRLDAGSVVARLGAGSVVLRLDAGSARLDIVAAIKAVIRLQTRTARLPMLW